MLVYFDQLEGIAKDLQLIVRSPRLSRLLPHQGVLFQWGWAYEFSMVEMLMMLFSGVDEIQILIDAGKADDPHASLLDFVRRYEPDFSSGKPKASKLLYNLSLLMATLKTLRALKLYAKSMNRLFHMGMQGDDESYILAARIDPSCLSSPSLAKRVCIAQMGGDSRFIKRIHKAAVDGPQKSLRVYEKLRFTTVLLEESGAFKTTGKDDLYKVLVEELRLYEANKGDPQKGLFRNIDLWRKASIT